MKIWRCSEVDSARAAAIASRRNIPLAAAYILCWLGLEDDNAVSSFLNPKLADVSDPFELAGAEPAAERVWRAIERNESIAIYGDYDVDGITSTALLLSILKKLGARRVECFLPERLSDGYGLSVASLERLLRKCEPGLIITVDCGTSSEPAIAEAAARFIDIIVTDHHEASRPPSGAFAVLNPKLGGSEEVKMLAGVGVVFKLCHALVKLGRASRKQAALELDLREHLEPVLLGTIADAVPLLGENRILVKQGLARLNCGTVSPGLKALSRVAKLNGCLDASHVSFSLAPRLNAASRVASPRFSLELLMTDDPDRAEELAAKLDQFNKERQKIERHTQKEAIAEIDSWFDPDQHFGIVAGSRGWHLGVIGIVASRLSAAYRRPVVLIAFDEDGIGRGSGRSIEGYSLLGGLEKCKDYLTGFGGHEMAAGLELSFEQYENFKAAFNEAASSALKGLDLRQCQFVNAWIELEEANEELCSVLNSFAPFGFGNPRPVFATRGLRVEGEPRALWGEHLRLTLAANGQKRRAIAFNKKRDELPDGPIDVAYCLRRNWPNGKGSPELLIQDWRPANKLI